MIRNLVSIFPAHARVNRFHNSLHDDAESSTRIIKKPPTTLKKGHFRSKSPIRQDAWAEENRIVVEEEKPAEEHGFYLHPRLSGQPAERSVEWARHPDLMREIQEMPQRLDAERQQSKP